MGGIINNPPFKETFHNPSASLLGTIVAIYEIGCFAGSVITALVGERLGRRMSILVGAIIMLGGAGFQAGVSSAGPMIAARVVSGLGMVSPPTDHNERFLADVRVSSIPPYRSFRQRSRRKALEDDSSASNSRYLTWVSSSHTGPAMASHR
jgi:MFS family permease